MNRIDRAARALYESQTERAGLQSAPSWGSLSEDDRDAMREDAQRALTAVGALASNRRQGGALLEETLSPRMVSNLKAATCAHQNPRGALYCANCRHDYMNRRGAWEYMRGTS